MVSNLSEMLVLPLHSQSYVTVHHSRIFYALVSGASFASLLTASFESCSLLADASAANSSSVSLSSSEQKDQETSQSQLRLKQIKLKFIKGLNKYI